MTDREIATARHMARLSKLPVRSGHARNLRRKLGVGAPEPAAPAPAAPKPKKAKAKAKKKK